MAQPKQHLHTKGSDTEEQVLFHAHHPSIRAPQSSLARPPLADGAAATAVAALLSGDGHRPPAAQPSLLARSAGGGGTAAVVPETGQDQR